MLLRLALSIALLVLLTIAEIRILPQTRGILTAIAIAAYAALVPSIVAVFTLWEEFKYTISQLLIKPRPRPRRRPLMNTFSRSRTLTVLSRSKPFSFVAKRMGNALAPSIARADLGWDPYNVATFFTILAVAIPSALYIALNLVIPTLFPWISIPLPIRILLPIVVGIVTIVTPMITAALKASFRRGGIDIELPFFTLYVSLIEKAGRSMFIAFERLYNATHIFKRMSVEASIVKKYATFFRPNPIDALEDYAKNVPSVRMQSLVAGYVGISRVGGDTATYLETRAREMLDDVVARWLSYAERISMMGEMLIAIFTLLPSILVVGAIAFSESTSFLIMDALTFFVVPLITAVMYIVVDSMQPKIPSTPIVTASDIIVAASGIPLSMVVCSTLCRVLKLPMYMTVCIAIAVALLPFLAIYIVRYGEVNAIEKDLPAFLRDVAEFLKIGFGIPKALNYIARSRSYNKFLDRYVRGLAMLLQLNVPIQRVQQSISTRSWLLNYSIFVISELESLGALSPSEVEALSLALERIVNAKRRARAQLLLYIALAIMTPAFVALLASMAFTIATTLPGAASLPGGTPFVDVRALRMLVEKSYLLAVVIAVCMGILAAKIRDGTGLNTSYAVISLVVLIAMMMGKETIMKLLVGR